MCSSAFYPLLSFFWANIQQKIWQAALIDLHDAKT